MARGIISRVAILFLCEALFSVCVLSYSYAETDLFQSKQVTLGHEYTFGIEGPAVDSQGNLFVVNFAKPGTIGKLPVGSLRSENFLDLPEGSVGNSIRFNRSGQMFIADYKKHNIFLVERGNAEPKVFFHSELFSQPNDMTIACDGTIYASDPDWKNRLGKIWRIKKGVDGIVVGEVMVASRTMGTTNGIDLSPDDQTLYVGESNSGQIWSYKIQGSKLISARLLKTFEPDTIDGIRTDVEGRLLIARILKGQIAIATKTGALEREIRLRGKEPTNLAFGGNDGKTVFVTQRQGGYIESFRTDLEGREYCLQSASCRLPKCNGAK